MKHVLAALALLLCASTLPSPAHSQTPLTGANVWEYPDGTVAIHYQGAWRYYVQLDDSNPRPPARPRPPGRRPGGPGPGRPSLCSNRPLEASLPNNTGAYQSEQIQPSRSAGGSVFEIGLTKYINARRVQVRVLRQQAVIHSAEVRSANGVVTAVADVPAERLCEGQGFTFNLPTSLSNPAQVLLLRMEGFSSDDVTVEVNVLYDSKLPKCGGCNIHGCWVQDASCNIHGCSIPGGSCNIHGCYGPGGGCNIHGCYGPGGGCSIYGCTKPASKNAGRASSTRPLCE